MHTHTHFLKTHLTIILPSSSGSSKWSLSRRFQHQNPVYEVSTKSSRTEFFFCRRGNAVSFYSGETFRGKPHVSSVKVWSRSNEISAFGVCFSERTFGRVGGMERDVLTEQRTNIKFLVKLGKNGQEILQMFVQHSSPHTCYVPRPSLFFSQFDHRSLSSPLFSFSTPLLPRPL